MSPPGAFINSKYEIYIFEFNMRSPIHHGQDEC